MRHWSGPGDCRPGGGAVAVVVEVEVARFVGPEPELQKILTRYFSSEIAELHC